MWWRGEKVGTADCPRLYTRLACLPACSALCLHSSSSSVVPMRHNQRPQLHIGLLGRPMSWMCSNHCARRSHRLLFPASPHFPTPAPHLTQPHGELGGWQEVCRASATNGGNRSEVPPSASVQARLRAQGWGAATSRGRRRARTAVTTPSLCEGSGDEVT